MPSSLTCVVWKVLHIYYDPLILRVARDIVIVSLCLPSSVLGYFILAPSLLTHLRGSAG
jgi:hypothetical protein